jgi:trans-aconitate 2-methyltransferase
MDAARREKQPPAGDMRWDAHQYLKFAEARTRPALDLLARIPPLAVRQIYDLGCGTGHLTRLLAGRWPEATVVGIDGSQEMLSRAAAGGGRIAWQLADIGSWEAEFPADLIVSNAALHWLPDHGRLAPRLLRQLAPEGVLAVQLPWNWNAPTHRLIREVLEEKGLDGGPFPAAALSACVLRAPVPEPSAYLDILGGEASAVELWCTEYFHRLEGPFPVLEWMKGTTLRPLLQVLDEGDAERFLHLYGERLAAAYPARADGTTLLPFRRLFWIARRRS